MFSEGTPENAILLAALRQASEREARSPLLLLEALQEIEAQATQPKILARAPRKGFLHRLFQHLPRI